MSIKIMKNDEIATLFVPYELQGKSYLCISMIVGFDLLYPEKSVNEQKIWASVNASLDGRMFDAGMPKINPEWLLSGACFSGPSPREVVKVSAHFAGSEKQIDVYGSRQWQYRQGRLVPSEPAPFIRQPLTWEMTWGGEDIAENKLGLSLVEESYPLACLFYSDDIHNSRVENTDHRSACFLPLAIDHPMRQACMGSYDEIWFRERWPSVPQNFDWHFFNQAPFDQRLTDFFKGGEAYHLVNLHPKEAVITGSLPFYRPRVFVRQYSDPTATPIQNVESLKQHDNEAIDQEIQYKISEIGLRNDTVWFFPEQQLGLRIFRGSIEVQDEEALDVSDILFVSEDREKNPLSTEHYVHYMAHYNAAKEAESAEMAQLGEKAQQAKLDLAEAEKELSDIPQYMAFKQGQFENKIPAGKTQPHDFLAQLDRQLDVSSGQLATLAQHASGLSPELQSLLAQSGPKIDAMKSSFAQQMQMHMKLKHDMATDLKQMKLNKPNVATNPEYGQQVQAMEEKLNAYGDILDYPQTDTPWHDKASELVAQSSDLDYFLKRCKKLMALGFRKLNIQRLMLGYLSHERVFVPQEWGLSMDDFHDELPTTLPSGWLLPEYQEGVFTALHIRQSLFEPETDMLVFGSETFPWHSALQVGLPVVMCQDRSFAWLIEQDVRGLVNVIEMPLVDTELSDDVQKVIVAAPQHFLFMQNIDDLSPWQAVFPALEPIGLKEDLLIEQAYAESVDLTGWLVEYITPIEGQSSTDQLANIQKTKRKSLFAVPQFTKEQAQAAFDQKQASLYQDFGLTAGMPLKAALNEAFEQKSASFKPKLPAGVSSDVFQKGLDKLKNAPLSTAPASEQFERLSQQSIALLEKEQANAKSDVAKDLVEKQLCLVKAEAQVAIDKMKELEAIAPPKINNDDTPVDFEKLSREQVIDWHERGLSLAKKDLSDLDLSNLDLSYVDMSGSILSETNFSGSKLISAKMQEVIATEAIFDSADLEGADLCRALLSESSGCKAHLSHACLDEAVLSDAQFNQANFTFASMNSMTASGSQFVGSNFNDSQLHQANLLNTLLDNASFIRCRAIKMKCFEAKAKESVWTDAKLDKALFWSADLSGADFTAAQLTNARFGSAQLPGVCFNQAVLVKANFADANLADAHFHQANMENIYISNTNMQRTQLHGVNLKRAQCIRSNFNGAHFQAVNAMQTNFMRSIFSNSTLDRVCFYNGDLYKTTFGNTHIKKCNFKATLLANNEDLING
ncbi:DUF2169 family type VI secretion system accessory protein [Shewanella surugensis]|uniref:DUF2169 domain-containing protein n=1 Tax=Shewanella surugensis TaxID=212020 RepID=A0ABT0L7V2_9GAMM|nr:DUF2169 domain-containing protein [Shewanella surugensis]MCL1123475.1 DUF2169 domain-containing protein [Shewanella surugensis]